MTLHEIDRSMDIAVARALAGGRADNRSLRELHQQWARTSTRVWQLATDIDEIATRGECGPPHVEFNGRMCYSEEEIDVAIARERQHRDVLASSEPSDLVLAIYRLVDEHEAKHGLPPRPGPDARPIEEIAAELKTQLAALVDAQLATRATLGIPALEEQHKAAVDECERLEEAMLAITPASVEDLAILFDFAAENDGHVDIINPDLPERRELLAFLRGLMRLAPSVKLRALDDIEPETRQAAFGN